MGNPATGSQPETPSSATPANRLKLGLSGTAQARNGHARQAHQHASDAGSEATGAFSVVDLGGTQPQPALGGPLRPDCRASESPAGPGSSFPLQGLCDPMQNGEHIEFQHKPTYWQTRLDERS